MPAVGGDAEGAENGRKQGNKQVRTEFRVRGFTPQKAVGCELFGVMMLVMFGYFALKGQATSKWPSVEGTVVESRVARSSPTSGGPRYYARVKYEYDVNGVNYAAKTISIGAMREFARESSAAKIVGKYPVGKRARVYYDPEDPSRAVLEPGASSDVITILPIGVFVVVIGLAVLVVFLLRKRAGESRRRRTEERRARRGRRTG